jgi:hypothetical protein
MGIRRGEIGRERKKRGAGVTVDGGGRVCRRGGGDAKPAATKVVALANPIALSLS